VAALSLYVNDCHGQQWRIKVRVGDQGSLDGRLDCVCQGKGCSGVAWPIRLALIEAVAASYFVLRRLHVRSRMGLSSLFGKNRRPRHNSSLPTVSYCTTVVRTLHHCVLAYRAVQVCTRACTCRRTSASHTLALVERHRLATVPTTSFAAIDRLIAYDEPLILINYEVNAYSLHKSGQQQTCTQTTTTRSLHDPPMAHGDNMRLITNQAGHAVPV